MVLSKKAWKGVGLSHVPVAEIVCHVATSDDISECGLWRDTNRRSSVHSVSRFLFVPVFIVLTGLTQRNDASIMKTSIESNTWRVGLSEKNKGCLKVA